MKTPLWLQNLKALFCVRCPNCSSWIWGWRARSFSQCPNCKADLESNWIAASIICVIVVLVTLPLFKKPVDWVAGLIFEEVDYSARRVVLVWFEFLLVALLYPRLLKLRIPKSSKEKTSPNPPSGG